MSQHSILYPRRYFITRGHTVLSSYLLPMIRHLPIKKPGPGICLAPVAGIRLSYRVSDQMISLRLMVRTATPRMDMVARIIAKPM